ncbi:S-(hydroxymethyl)glutathione synthase [Acinetobacter sp. LoGeW2-3]|uniref:GFA family protein n=1 Tax=Acinetobacter sp. LoGeW2-3 TaxID=1808001 RepID=UPI000C05CA6C|nr:GFA family protein [Acinetobacter sp. LoGeW2-3]ATO19970.1 S-(hydroxymethyl)glutathione synthase [Acinetobacter sp. LoGeW2-3]
MKARCLCGATQFEVQLRNHEVAACHCSMCCRQTGGPLMSIDIEDINFIDQQHLSVFKSSEWAERGFCGACGTFIFWRTIDHSFANINVFTLDELPEDLDFNLEIYVDHQPEFYAFNNHTKKMTEAEVIEMFSSDNS